jgi:oligopeptide transport system permease protein
MPEAIATTTSRTAHYERLLAEAARVKGTSLWRDAWRRLQRNRVAMVALTYLILLGAAALLTPLLPLQSPIKQDLKFRQLLRPSWSTKSVLSAEQLAVTPPESLVVRLDFGEQRKAIAAAEAELRAASPVERPVAQAKVAELRRVYEETIDKLWNLETPKEATDEAGNQTKRVTLQSVFDSLTRLMIRARLAMFGDWCVPSICGTDHLGRDLLSRLFWGARVSLMVGIVATFVSLLIGVSYWAIAGYVGGWVDNAMMRFVDVLYSIPFIFVVIFVITILNDEEVKKKLTDEWGLNKILVFYLLIGAIYWLTMSRVVRGQVISLKHEQFVEAARTIGASRARIIFRHLVPNVLSIVIVYLTLTIPAVMLFEAFLSFLGLGVDPPDVSWGLLANEAIKVLSPSNENIWKATIFWWLVLFPGMALALTLFALNFLGDGLRDALDPRMKNR